MENPVIEHIDGWLQPNLALPQGSRQGGSLCHRIPAAFMGFKSTLFSLSIRYRPFLSTTLQRDDSRQFHTRTIRVSIGTSDIVDTDIEICTKAYVQSWLYRKKISVTYLCRVGQRWRWYDLIRVGYWVMGGTGRTSSIQFFFQLVLPHTIYMTSYRILPPVNPFLIANVVHWITLV